MIIEGPINHIQPQQHGQQLQRCPLCGHPAGMWEVRTRLGVFKAVMCDRTEHDEGRLGDVPDCPLTLTGSNFNHATYREAARYWNRFAEACVQSRADMAFRTAA